MEQYQGKKILVVGLGLQGGGVGIAKFFSELGAKVTVTDKKTEKELASSLEALKDYSITFRLGGHNMNDFLEADMIFKGPSVLWSAPEVVAAEKKGIPIEMELSFFSENFPGRIIGVTGTRGKSTITRLLFDLLKQSGFPVLLGGGLPGISTINYLKTLGKDDWIVMEISSWALSGFHRKKISPHIAVFSNIYPDHLNYYKTMDDYLYDKKAVFMYQNENDFLIVNKSLLNIVSTSKSKIFPFDRYGFPSKLIYLKGDHNLENAAAALQVAKILNIDEKKSIDFISSYKGLPYRQEIIGRKEDIIFVNDTTSTTPIATIKAIDSFKDKKTVLILGGNSKNLPYEGLLAELNKVEKIVLLAGSFTNQIIDDLRASMSDKISLRIYDDLEEAVKEAYRIAREINSTCILFSPAATSFAMFNNEFHRGEEFNKIAKKIIKL
ncbi:UDP-N-acetylmuramoyl-L-alanine--D-glutamate ligase [Candidatus Roizmanbacteria bacterium]|nr:UDP-N-acetylmuramoyl-L-alanine--D-glutamate ligase [Candidatus Roizmanbacteria bacterium]